MGPLKTFLGRYFYFSMALVFAALVVWGFSRTVNDNLFHAAPPRPFLLWVHGAAFSLGVLFFISQSGLVRIRKVECASLPRLVRSRTGLVDGFLGLCHRRRHGAVRHSGTSSGRCLCISVDSVLRHDRVRHVDSPRHLLEEKSEFHRRLVFIATVGLMDAALGRFDYVFNHNLFYPCLDLLIVLGMARDLVVDRRVSRVYLYTLPVLIVGQSLSVYMWRLNPSWWQSITHAIVG